MLVVRIVTRRAPFLQLLCHPHPLKLVNNTMKLIQPIWALLNTNNYNRLLEILIKIILLQGLTNKLLGVIKQMNGQPRLICIIILQWWVVSKMSVILVLIIHKYKKIIKIHLNRLNKLLIKFRIVIALVLPKKTQINLHSLERSLERKVDKSMIFHYKYRIKSKWFKKTKNWQEAMSI